MTTAAEQFDDEHDEATPLDPEHRADETSAAAVDRGNCETQTRTRNTDLPATAPGNTRANPSMPLRKSTASTTTSTRICGVIWLMWPRPRTSGSAPPDPADPHAGAGCASWRRSAVPVRRYLTEPAPCR